MNRATRVIGVGEPIPGMKQGRARVRPRHTAGQMNALEKRYADILNLRRNGGDVAHWWFEAITLKLAHDTRYTPDFMVQLVCGTLQLIDVKGWKAEEDAAVKMRVAATMFPFEIIEVTYDKTSGWTTKTIGPKQE